MSENDHHDLLTAMAAELADIRAEIEAAGELMSEVLRLLPPETRLSYLTRSQTFDVLAQRIEALGGLAVAVAADQPMDTALAALPLAEMAERMQETTHRARPAAAPRAAADDAADDADDVPASAAGVLQLF